MTAVPPNRRTDESNETGSTLVELLLATAILGIGVTAVVGGMMTSITGSDISRRESEATSLSRSYAEAVAGDAYAACATTYPAAGFVAPAGFTATMTVSYWDVATSTFLPSCGTDSGVQRLTLSVVSTDARGNDVLLVAKRLKPTGETS